MSELELDLDRLRHKYATMRALRVANDEAKARGEAHHPARDALRALAHEFPGALAEIDRIPFSLLEARLHELERAAEPPRWAQAWIDVHRMMRGALAIKAWLAGRRTIDAATRTALMEALANMRFHEDARTLVDRVQEIANPPRGRLVDWVFDEVASRHGVDRHALRALLMPRTDATSR